MQVAYRFRVRAVNSSGAGVFSPETNAVVTIGDIPGAPAELRVRDVQQTSLRLEWRRHEDDGENGVDSFEARAGAFRKLLGFSFGSFRLGGSTFGADQQRRASR